MTTFNPGTGGTIPSAVDTIAKLVLWTAERIRSIQPVRTYTLNSFLRPLPIVDLQVIKHRDFGTRAAILWYLEMPSDWRSTDGKLFKKPTGIPIDSNSPGGSTNSLTVGTGGSLPSDVNTVARLGAWVAECAERTTPGYQVIESDDVGLIDIASIHIGEDDDSNNLFEFRCSVPLNPAYASLDQALYKSALNMSSAAIPTTLLSN